MPALPAWLAVVDRADLERAIRASWSERTCDPVDLPDWSPENAARGQCGVTALVVQDLMGGEQFAPTEAVQAPSVAPRPRDVTGARLEAQYRTLAASVRARLAGA